MYRLNKKRVALLKDSYTLSLTMLSH